MEKLRGESGSGQGGRCQDDKEQKCGWRKQVKENDRKYFHEERNMNEINSHRLLSKAGEEAELARPGKEKEVGPEQEQKLAENSHTVKKRCE